MSMTKSTPDAQHDLSQGTHEAESIDAHATHTADRMPTADEERIAETQHVDADVARNYREAMERGAHVKGEGAIE